MISDALLTDTLPDLLTLARQAGVGIMEIYAGGFTVETKADDSPLTEADRRSNEIIAQGLQALTPDIPILSEESLHAPYDERRHWSRFWLVDPLDGTREFVKRNDEFTVNIALMIDNQPVFGIIYAPALDQMYYALQSVGSFRVWPSQPAERINARPQPADEALVIIGSRSHPSKALATFIDGQQAQYGEVRMISAGSALKFCRVAEGAADMYPRLGPTMEWDTAAGHIIALESGKQVLRLDAEQTPEGPLLYNKPDLRNPWFLCG